MERDDVVLEMHAGLRGMVYNFARKFNLDFDDCWQDASLIMLEVWPRIPGDCTNIKAYLNGTVRNTLYKRLLSRSVETLSLDLPVSPDADETFADTLQAPVEQDTRRSDHVASVVHSALRKLSLEVQLYAIEAYGLGSYKPVLPRKPRKVVYGRQKASMRRSLKVAFQKDSRVLALLS